MSANFVGYLIGYVIAIVGVGYALNAAGVPREWIIAAVLILIGLGIVYALRHSEQDRSKRGVSRPAQYREESVERNYGSGPGGSGQGGYGPGGSPGQGSGTRSTTTTRTYE